jgi:hypothetical protein
VKNAEYHAEREAEQLVNLASDGLAGPADADDADD